jgi:hypothetical protein
MTKSILKLLSNFINICLLSSILFYCYSLFRINDLPDASDIYKELEFEPSQTLVKVPNFSFSYIGNTYQIEPKAKYEISGLVVSHNNINSFADIYHDETSVDIKDICLIWGRNLNNEIFKNVSFWNESVSCHVKYDKLPNSVKFYMTDLSNNHLISSDAKVRQAISNIRVGDQVTLKGKLVNYWDSRYPEFVRKTSLNRKDTAGGACEVMFVESVEIIKKFSRTWHNIYDISKNLILPLLIIKIVAFCLFAWLEFKFC